MRQYGPVAAGVGIGKDRLAAFSCPSRLPGPGTGDVLQVSEGEDAVSRAFVKEEDDRPLPPLPDWPVSDAPNLVTARGLAQIEDKVVALQAQLAQAEEDGQRAHLRRDLRYWSARLATARLVQPDPASTEVAFGACVFYRELPPAGKGRAARIRIVGEDEAEPAAGMIAYTAPLARTLMGLEPGEVGQLHAGGRVLDLEVVEVAAPVE